MLINFYFGPAITMLIVDQLMNSCVHCLSCLDICGSIYTNESNFGRLMVFVKKFYNAKDKCEGITF